jgi:hypothetical protein
MPGCITASLLRVSFGHFATVVILNFKEQYKVYQPFGGTQILN